MIKSYTLDCGCAFEHKGDKYEPTNTCEKCAARDELSRKRALVAIQHELNAEREGFLGVPQAGGPSREHQECPGCDDPMCHKYTGKVTHPCNKVTTLGELLCAPTAQQARDDIQLVMEQVSVLRLDLALVSDALRSMEARLPVVER